MRQAGTCTMFCESLLSWFASHKRTLPWRDLKIEDDTQRAYMILVSEVMLQQTQVPRVIVIFRRFLEQFPTIQDLAQASNRDVIIAWRGMGYNSRALRLRDAAKTIVERSSEGRAERKGRKDTPLRPPLTDFAKPVKGKVVFPHEYDDLIGIKGIGPYTAAAIRNFAFNLPTPCIDTNIRRILHRVLVGPEKPDGSFKTSDKQMIPLADSVLRIALEREANTRKIEKRCRGAADWHAALMDFGSLVCKKRSPHCATCPMKTTCKSAFRIKKSQPLPKPEPGRFVGSTYIPNRIFRGKVIEALRDRHGGLTVEALGKRVCIDWDREAHRAWLERILTTLEHDHLILRRGSKFVLEDKTPLGRGGLCTKG